jgi:putative DNA-invertase from lambdoid prophage Rac
MKAVIYCRVSTEDQNVKQQSDYINEWCKRQNIEIIKTVLDEESGRLPLVERKRFRKLLDESKNNPNFDSIIVYNIDRLTRNWDDVTLIEKHFRENWNIVKLISTSDEINLANASGRAMFRIKMAMCCYMPEDMREKQKIGIERAKKEGKFKGGKVGRSWSQLDRGPNENKI